MSHDAGSAVLGYRTLASPAAAAALRDAIDTAAAPLPAGVTHLVHVIGSQCQITADADALHDGVTVDTRTGRQRHPSGTAVVWVFFVAGQSNALGQANETDLTTQALLAEDATIPYWYDLAAGTTGLVSTALAGMQSIGDDLFGAELKMAADLKAAKAASDVVAFVKVAKGNTSLVTDWASTGSMWTRFCAAWDAALPALRAAYPTKSVVPAAMLWIQGEADAMAGTTAANAYAANLASFIDRVREYVGRRDLYAQVVRLHTSSPFGGPPTRDTIRAAQDAVGAADYRVDVINPDAYTMSGGPEPPQGHYTADALQDIGAAAAAAYLASAVGGFR